MIGDAQIVVRAEVEHPLAVYDDPGPLGTPDRANGVEQTLILERLKFVFKPGKFVVRHDWSSGK